MLKTPNVFKIHNLERDIDTDKIHQLEDTVEILNEQIEILNEQIESLKLELANKNHELKETEEELSYTNHELCILNELYVTSLEPLPISEVEKLIKDLLASKKSTKDILVE